MTDKIVQLNTIQPGAPRRDALLKNMTRLAELVEAATTAPPTLPRLGCFSGWSGYSKSFAAAYAAAQYQAFYVEANEFWTRRVMLKSLCHALGLGAIKAPTDELALRVGERLVSSNRALIIDEFDIVVDRGLVGVVRSLHKMTKAPIVMIGEEGLPNKLVPTERFHNLIGFWDQAQPCDLDDARALAGLYCRGIEVADDLLADCNTAIGGSARRLSANLNEMRRVAIGEGWRRIDLAAWGDRAWITGEAPATRPPLVRTKAGGRRA